MKVTSGELSQNSKLKTQSGTKNTLSTKLSVVLSGLKRISSSGLRNPVFVASLAVTGLLVGGRQLSLLEPLELGAFDRMMQLRPALPPDSRLLVVEVTEEDIASQEKWPLTDAVINQLFAQLERYQPAAIGLDIYRDKPQPPGNAELSNRMQKSDRIIPLCKRSNADDPGTGPPPNVPESRVGFSDLAIDNNGIIRRGLLFADPIQTRTGCTTSSSFSFQLALQYLQQKGIKPKLIKQNSQSEYLQLGKVVFKPLSPTDGGYQKADAGGYQILLNYRSGKSVARSVTLTDVLNNRLDPSWVKDRIVLIGVTASSIDDAFYTPYSSAQERIYKMPGVVVHGQIVSQLLSAVLDGRPLFWFFPEWGEVLWILSWSLIGGILVQGVRHTRQLILGGTMALGLLLGTSVLLFFGSAWVPVVAPMLGLITTSTGVLAYSVYEAKRERAYIAKQAQEQEKNIALLQELLKERTTYLPSNQTDALATEHYDLEALPTEHYDTNALPTKHYDTASDESDESTAFWEPQDVADKVGRTNPIRSERVNVLAGRYQTSRVLGSGGFGLTYLAEDIQRPGRPQCVVKHLKPARRDEKFLKIARRLFNTEAEILEKLGSHAQIPRLLAYFEERKEFYLVQEYIQGHSLSDELPVDKRLPEGQVVELLKDVLEILIFVHEHSVIHRDIKPTNIMRRQSDGKVVLIDFGAVKQMQPQDNPDQEGFTVAIGTRGYAPPEQYAGHPGFSSDIFALGMIGVQAVTGIPPHQLAVSPETGDVSWRHLANVSEKFAEILESMVRYHFVERYQSATLVMADLRGLKS